MVTEKIQRKKEQEKYQPGGQGQKGIMNAIDDFCERFDRAVQNNATKV